jgi:hypothetical protein
LSCSLVPSLGLTLTQTLTLTAKQLDQQEARNAKENKQKQGLEVASQKRGKIFKEKRRVVARVAEKARKDSSDATAAQQVRQDSRQD